MPSVIQSQFRKDNITTAAPFLVAAGNLALVGWNASNSGTGAAWLKLYNAVQASDVTVGTTTIVRTLLIPAGPGTILLSNEDKFQLAFNVGIVAAITASMIDSSSDAPGAACQVEILYNTNI